MQLINDLLSDVIITTRPLLGSLNCCKFTVSCTDWAAIELRTNTSLANATKKICIRLLRCWFSK